MLLVLSGPFFARQSGRVTELAIRHRLLSMFIFRAYTEGGGLMSYGADNVAMYRQGASYVAMILQGANPTNLPVELPTKFEFAVNRKTAKALASSCRPQSCCALMTSSSKPAMSVGTQRPCRHASNMSDVEGRPAAPSRCRDFSV